MSMRDNLFQEIADILTNLNSEISRQNKIGRTDLNYEAEEIYCTVLNLVCGWELQITRRFHGRPQIVDLVDDERRLAVEITSSNTLAKIRHTLSRFCEYQMQKDYSRLIILIMGNRLQFRTPIKSPIGLDFDLNRDLWDENRLLHEIEALDVIRLKELRDYLRNKISGLGQPILVNISEDNMHELNRIIRDYGISTEIIDKSLLEQNTIRFEYDSLIDGTRLRMVSHLFVIASPEKPVDTSIAKGGYISQDNSWLLLVQFSPEQAISIIAQCTKLTCLVIRGHSFEELSLDHARELKKLEILENSKPIRFLGNKFLTSLEQLCIRTPQLVDKLDFRNATQLQKLTIELRTKSCVRIEGLDWCGSLSVLELQNISLDVIDLDRLRNIKMLHLHGMDTEIHIRNKHDHLTKLWLHTCTVTSLAFLPQLVALEILVVFGSRTPPLGLDVPVLSMCQNLTKISFEHTKLHAVGELPSHLSELNLFNTGLPRIPDSVRHMQKLNTLDLNGLDLRELPTWLADLNLPIRVNGGLCLTGILMEGTRVEGVDLRTIPEQQELLKEWLEALHDKKTQTQNEVKVVFLGDGEAGKSHIVKRLEQDGALVPNFDGDATPGIAISNKRLDLTDRSVVVRVWDFGGQEILHAMHRIFMTTQTLYVVVLNARNDTQDHRAEHWLRFIYSFDKDARVMLVLNKIDQNPRASINLNRLQRLFPGLSEMVKMSAKEDSPEDFVDHFIKPLQQQLEKFDVLKSPFPKTWRLLEEKLEGVNERYIRERDYKKYCSEVGISKPEVINELLSRFVNLGVCFRCEEETWTRSFLLLEPKWATNAIYKILFNQHKKVNNGIIGVSDIQDCLLDDRTTWSVDESISYNEDEVNYILKVMRSYGLSFSMNDDEENEFIPMLCDRNEPQLMKAYVEDPTVLEFWLQFDYLPDNLLFHLMVELSSELDTDNVWLSGARFRDPDTQHCIIVERDSNTLKLYAENKPGRDFARQHMESMERNIRKVIAERFPGMVTQTCETSGRNAAAVNVWDRYLGIRRWLVHKLNGKWETFDLNRLEADENCQHYSKLLKTTILAKDLLQRCYRGMDMEQSMLIEALVEACVDVQGNNNPHENPRNTYVRDILQAKRYDVRDQTLCGKAEGKNEAGELDMEIRRDPGKPWTIFEALNHNDYDYWKRHLSKLLKNYNSHNLKMLFLVVYIDNKDFAVVTERYRDVIKSYAPDDFHCISESAEELTDIFSSDMQGIKVLRCRYGSGVGYSTVYHILVHMDERITPKKAKKNTGSKFSDTDGTAEQRDSI